MMLYLGQLKFKSSSLHSYTNLVEPDFATSLKQNPTFKEARQRAFISLILFQRE